MTAWELSRKERGLFEALVTRTRDAKILRRAQALLWLDQSDTVEEVAERLCLSRQTIYNWWIRFDERDGLELGERLSDGERSGRPCTAQGIIDPLIDAIIERDPRQFGYRSSI